MPRTIVTVTPNPALDMTWAVDSVRPGGSHRVAAARVRAGGKGLNVARVSHSQGLPVVAVTTSGGTVGAELARELAASGVPHALVPVAAETRRSVAVYDEAAADTMIFNERGIAPTGSEWAELISTVHATLDVAGVLVISGSLPPGIGEAELRALIALGSDRGVPVIVDTSGPLLLAAASAGASLLKPNIDELREATGAAEPLRGIAMLLELGAGAVLCSLGADGMLLASASNPDERSGRHARRARLAQRLTGNPTGAGDAAVAAAASLAASGAALGETDVLRRATSWSAAAVMMPLAGEISPQHTSLEAQLLLDVVTATDLAGSSAADRSAAADLSHTPGLSTAPNPGLAAAPHSAETHEGATT